MTKTQTTTFYLINLDGSDQRLSQSAARLAEQQIEFERIPAVLGRALSEQERLTNYSPELNKKQYYYPLSPAQIGCYMSHRKAWQKIADSDEPFGVVLEDDFVLPGDLNKAVQALKDLEIEWDMIKLAAYANRDRPIEFKQTINDHFDLVVHKKPMSGGAATAITKAAATKLLASTERFGRPCDTDIQYFWERGINVLSLMPYPVSQDLRYESTIETKSHKKDKKPLRRLAQQISQYWLNKSAVKEQVKELKKQLFDR